MKKIIHSIVLASMLFDTCYGDTGNLTVHDPVDTTYTNNDGSTSTQTTTTTTDSNGKTVGSTTTTTTENTDGTVSSKTEVTDENGDKTTTDSSKTVDLESIKKYQTSNLQAPMNNLLATGEWKLFLSEFEMTMNVGICSSPLLGAIPGLKSSMIDPIGYFEISHKPLYFPFANIDLNANPIQTGSPHQLSEDNSFGRPQTINAHYIYMPILGILLKKNMQFVCLHNGPVYIAYLSEFDPSYRYDVIAMQLHPEIILMIDPSTLVSSIFSCVAATAYDAIKGHGAPASFNDASYSSLASMDSINTGIDNGTGTLNSYKSQGTDFLKMVLNSFFFVDGCNSFLNIGGYSVGDDPINDGAQLWHALKNSFYTFTAISKIPLLQKEVNLNIERNVNPNAPFIPDTMCAPANFAMGISADGLVQLSGYPTTQKGHEQGSPSILVSTVANLPGAQGAAYLVWKRRDYYAFAYACPGEKSSSK